MSTAQKVDARTALWDASTWSAVVDHVGETFGMSAGKRAALESHTIAQLVASIAYLADCTNPMRVAVSNLTVYVASIRGAKPVFNHNQADDHDVFARFAMAHYPGGDQRIVERGLSLLALSMIADYRRDVVSDVAEGKYNPIAAGVWDYDSLEADLLDRIAGIDCPRMDAIVTVPEVYDKPWACAPPQTLEWWC